MAKKHSRKTLTASIIATFPDIIPHSERGRQRYAAFKGYLNWEPVAKLADYKVSRSTIAAMCEQAVQTHEDGQPWGFRVCEPEAFHSDRKQNPDSRSSAWRFINWIETDSPKHAELRNLIRLASALERFNLSYFVREIFIPFCESELELKRGENYPLTILDCGESSLRRYVRDLKTAEATERLETENDAKDASSVVIRSLIRVAKPMQILQFDECKIDLIGTLAVEDATGRTRYIPLKDATMLLLVDANRPIIYGYIVFFHPVVSLEDLLEAFAELDGQWRPRKIKPGRKNYQIGATLPSGAFKEFQGAQPSLVMGDRAKAHKAYQFSMLERLLRAFCYHLGKPHQWSIRIGVEGKFSVLDKRDLQNQPNTTGTGPDDPRRQGAFESAVALETDGEDFLGRVDVAITDYMLASHGGPSGLVQLREILEHDKNFMTRTLPPPAAGQPPIGSFLLNLRVRQDAVGHYVEHHAKWYGPSLKKIPLGQWAAVLFPRADVQYPTLYTAGAEDGKLFISAQWKSPNPLSYASLLAQARFKAKYRYVAPPNRSAEDLRTEVELLKELALKSSRSKPFRPNAAASALFNLRRSSAGQLQSDPAQSPAQLPSPTTSEPVPPPVPLPAPVRVAKDEGLPTPLLTATPDRNVNTLDTADDASLNEEMKRRILAKGLFYRGGKK